MLTGGNTGPQTGNTYLPLATTHPEGVALHERRRPSFRERGDCSCCVHMHAAVDPPH